MISSVLQSDPAASSELAITAINGMIGQAGQGKIVKVLNIDVREVNDGYIAVAMIEIEEPQLEEKQQEKAERERDPVEGNSAERGDHAVDLYYLRSHMSEAERAIPDAEAQPLPQVNVEEMRDAITPVETEADRRKAAGETDIVVAGPDTLTPQADDLSDKIQTDFAGADMASAPAYNVDPRELATEQLADKPLDRMSPQELEELRGQVEERLKNMPPEAIPPVEEAVNPNPSA